MTREWVKRVLGRDETDSYDVTDYGKVMITGAAGSIGIALAQELHPWARDLLQTDIVKTQRFLDVRDSDATFNVMDQFKPDVVFHLAGAKHAPEGEENPYLVMMTNVLGTKNVLDAGKHVGATVVVASTCKAGDPETAYGASKLIAERMALNAGQRVARFFNVVESSGNVFETWRALDPLEPIPVTDCRRIFMSMQEAVGLLLFSADAPIHGRYAHATARGQHMIQVAKQLYGDRSQIQVARRRGDRYVEPLCGLSEKLLNTADARYVRIVSPHDPPLT